MHDKYDFWSSAVRQAACQSCFTSTCYPALHIPVSRARTGRRIRRRALRDRERSGMDRRRWVGGSLAVYAAVCAGGSSVCRVESFPASEFKPAKSDQKVPAGTRSVADPGTDALQPVCEVLAWLRYRLDCRHRPMRRSSRPR